MIRAKKSGAKRRTIENRYITTFMVVLLAATMTFIRPGGKGALILWPLFGALNQLLAALGLAIVSIYLYKKKKNYLLALIPMIFVLVMTLWAMEKNLLQFISDQNILLASISVLVILLTIWLLAGGGNFGYQK